VAASWPSACDRGARTAADGAGLPRALGAAGVQAWLAFRPRPSASTLVSCSHVKSAGDGAPGTAAIWNSSRSAAAAWWGTTPRIRIIA
jgi:hypothetical protein